MAKTQQKTSAPSERILRALALPPMLFGAPVPFVMAVAFCSFVVVAILIMMGFPTLTVFAVPVVHFWGVAVSSQRPHLWTAFLAGRRIPRSFSRDPREPSVRYRADP